LIIAYGHHHPVSLEDDEAHGVLTEWGRQFGTRRAGFERLDKLPHGSG
jgi:hypothetical protein